jgi:hypothetical protein
MNHEVDGHKATQGSRSSHHYNLKDTESRYTMSLFCLSSEPLSENEKKGRHGAVLGQFSSGRETFDKSLCQVPCSSACPCCIGTMLCYCPAQVYMRHSALNHVQPGSGWKNYTCCQGYYGGCCCVQPGQMCESTCPVPCMCLESTCCPGLAVSATSMVIREHYRLSLDKDDVRLIRCSNCLQIFACCCSIVACLTDCEADDRIAEIINWIADCVFCSVAGCSTAQAHHEIKLREKGGAPQRQQMSRY